MRVLVVEDNEVDAELLSNALRGFGYDVTCAVNGIEALELVRTSNFKMVISDWEMPEMTGIDLCRQIRARHYSSYVYVILLTSRTGTPCVVEGLNAGADDFISKPFHPQELHVRVRAGQRVLSLQSRDVTIFSLARLAESRDSDTGAHLERMREYSRIIALHLSQRRKYRDRLDGDAVELIYLTSPLHDIGKVGIPDHVLLKQGPLTPDEFEVMKQHTVIGGQTLDAAMRAYPEAAFLRMARDIAWTHHERYDGTGYPHGLAGEEIPLCGRIVALADVYDALTSKRVYKEAYTHEQARAMLILARGTHFDPDIVDAFLECEQEFLDVRERFDDWRHEHDYVPAGQIGLDLTPA